MVKAHHTANAIQKAEPIMVNQRNKDQIRKFWDDLDAAGPAEVDRICTAHFALDCQWNGPAPLYLKSSPKAITESFWAPLKQAVPDLKRETHMMFGGASSGRVNGDQDGEMWVCGTGYLTGHAQSKFMGIPATDHPLRLRWGEFYLLREGKIIASQMILDFVDWFEQIGISVLPKSQGVAHVYPAPTGFDGLLQDQQDPLETDATMQFGRQFIYGGLNQYDTTNLSSMGMAGFFHKNLKWYGPGGIGACLSLDEFETRHQRPWLVAFPDRKVQDLDCLIAEGPLLGAAGIAGVKATHSGPYINAAATGKPISVSGLDFWLRDGNRLTENWVFVDMIDLFTQMGQDLFARMRVQTQSLKGADK